MEIVIENPQLDTSTTTTSPGSSSFTSRPYRPTYPPNVGNPKTADPQLSLRRVDRSGLLEIPELEPQRNSSRLRGTSSSTDNHSGTLTRRVDRSGLLEAVPEVPDLHCCRSPEKTLSTMTSEDPPSRLIADRQLTGAESNLAHRQQATSPRTSCRSSLDLQTGNQTLQRRSVDVATSQEDCRIVGSSPTNVSSTPVTLSASVSSPYLRRYPGGSPTSLIERPTPIVIGFSAEDAKMRNRNSFTCVTSPGTTKFLPIDDSTLRNRQSYVDLTGASYTRSTSTSPRTIQRVADTGQTFVTESTDVARDKRQQPDCLGRLSPRSRNDGSSALTMSAIPDVIEAHGSRSHVRDNDRDDDAKDGPEGQRAEAEGCEHSAIGTHEEQRVTFKPTNKIIHNDNIQTLRVIILSEQL